MMTSPGPDHCLMHLGARLTREAEAQGSVLPITCLLVDLPPGVSAASSNDLDGAVESLEEHGKL